MKALVIYPGNKALGGITTVVNQHIEYLRSNDVHVRTIQTTSTRNIFEKIYLTILSYLVFLFFLIVFKPNVVVVHYASNLSFIRKSLFILTSKMFRFNTICHLHGGGFIDFYSSSNSVFRYYIRAILNCATVNVVLGSIWQKFFKEDLNLVNVVVIPNSFEFNESGRNVSEEKCIDVIYVGRVEKNKGVFDLVQSLQSMQEDISVCFVGRVIDDGVPDVYLKGELPYESVLNLIGRSKVLCLPSYIEAFPLVILEGIAADAIVVATDVGAVKDILGVDYPFIFEKGDVDTLSNILTAIKKDPKLALEKVRENYSRCKIDYDCSKVLSDLLAEYSKFSS
jgi:glycosyltransferase involved in cell wall biosynthesis